MSILGNRIKKERENLNLTREELAQKIGVSYSAIAMYEQGNREPNNELILKMCNIFNCSTDYLVGFSNFKTNKDALNDYLKTESKLTTLKTLERYYEDFVVTCQLKENDIDEIANILSIDDNNIESIKEKMEVFLNKFEDPKKKKIKELFKIILKELSINQNSRASYHYWMSLIEQEFKMNEETPKYNSASVFIYGTIPAGVPMECIEDIIDTEDIPADMLKGGKQYFGLKIKGDSMYPEYLDNDTIILLKQDDCESGDDCVVMVNGNDGTFKRVFKTENGIILQPLNNSYQPMIYTNEQVETLPVRILGKVVELRRKK